MKRYRVRFFDGNTGKQVKVMTIPAMDEDALNRQIAENADAGTCWNAVELDPLYWCGNGEEQDKYDELYNSGWNFTKKSESIFHSYYRYFNDGDFPGWARKDWSLVKCGRWGKELNSKGLELQEKRVTEAVLYEYARYIKAKGGK